MIALRSTGLDVKDTRESLKLLKQKSDYGNRADSIGNHLTTGDGIGIIFGRSSKKARQKRVEFLNRLLDILRDVLEFGLGNHYGVAMTMFTDEHGRSYGNVVLENKCKGHAVQDNGLTESGFTKEIHALLSSSGEDLACGVYAHRSSSVKVMEQTVINNVEERIEQLKTILIGHPHIDLGSSLQGGCQSYARACASGLLELLLQGFEYYVEGEVNEVEAKAEIEVKTEVEAKNDAQQESRRSFELEMKRIDWLMKLEAEVNDLAVAVLEKVICSDSQCDIGNG